MRKGITVFFLFLCLEPVVCVPRNAFQLGQDPLSPGNSTDFVPNFDMETLTQQEKDVFSSLSASSGGRALLRAIALRYQFHTGVTREPIRQLLTSIGAKSLLESMEPVFESLSRKISGCVDGQFNDGSGQCLPCRDCRPDVEKESHACTSYHDRECTPVCAAAVDSRTGGQFMNEQKVCTTCTPCPDGKQVTQSCDGVNDRGCGDCPLGSDARGNVLQCTPCASGTYQPSVGTACTRCTEYQASIGSDCPAGQALKSACSPTTDKRCAVCDSVNEFLDTYTGSCQQCLLCPPGKYAVCATQDSDCQVCPLGTQSPGGRAQCSACETGKYSVTGICLPCATTCAVGSQITSPCTASANLVCTVCGSGTGSNGDTACAACSAGTFSAAGVCTKCSECSAGFEQTKECTASQNAECTACKPGTGSTGGTSKCEVCESGKYSAGGVCTDCSTCPDGSLMTKACTTIVDTTCTPCPPGEIVKEGKCQRCELAQGSSASGGEYADKTICRQCTDCTGNNVIEKQCSASGDRVCKECTERNLVPSGAHDSCVPCPLGQYPDSNKVCQPCVAGYTSTYGAECTSYTLPSGNRAVRVQGTTSTDNILACNSGFFFNEDQCIACPEKTFKSEISNRCYCSPCTVCNGGESQACQPDKDAICSLDTNSMATQVSAAALVVLILLMIVPGSKWIMGHPKRPLQGTRAAYIVLTTVALLLALLVLGIPDQLQFSGAVSMTTFAAFFFLLSLATALYITRGGSLSEFHCDTDEFILDLTAKPGEAKQPKSCVECAFSEERCKSVNSNLEVASCTGHEKEDISSCSCPAGHGVRLGSTKDFTPYVGMQHLYRLVDARTSLDFVCEKCEEDSISHVEPSNWFNQCKECPENEFSKEDRKACHPCGNFAGSLAKKILESEVEYCPAKYHYQESDSKSRVISEAFCDGVAKRLYLDSTVADNPAVVCGCDPGHGFELGDSSTYTCEECPESHVSDGSETSSGETKTKKDHSCQACDVTEYTVDHLTCKQCGTIAQRFGQMLPDVKQAFRLCPDRHATELKQFCAGKAGVLRVKDLNYDCIMCRTLSTAFTRIVQNRNAELLNQCPDRHMSELHALCKSNPGIPNFDATPVTSDDEVAENLEPLDCGPCLVITPAFKSMLTDPGHAGLVTCPETQASLKAACEAVLGNLKQDTSSEVFDCEPCGTIAPAFRELLSTAGVSIEHLKCPSQHEAQLKFLCEDNIKGTAKFADRSYNCEKIEANQGTTSFRSQDDSQPKTAVVETEAESGMFLVLAEYLLNSDRVKQTE